MLSVLITEPGVVLLADGNVEAVYPADGFVIDRLGVAEWSPLGVHIDIPRDSFDIVEFIPFSVIFRDPSEWHPLTSETPDGCYDACRKDNAIIGVLVKYGGYTLVIGTDYWTNRGLDDLPDGVLVRPHREELARLPAKCERCDCPPEEMKERIKKRLTENPSILTEVERRIQEEEIVDFDDEPQPEERPRVITGPGDYVEFSGIVHQLTSLSTQDEWKWMDIKLGGCWNDYGERCPYGCTADIIKSTVFVGPCVEPPQEPRRIVVTVPDSYYDVEGRVWQVKWYEDGTDGYHWRNPYGDQRWNNYGERWPKAQQPGTHLVGRVGQKPQVTVSEWEFTKPSREEVASMNPVTTELLEQRVESLEQRLAALESPAKPTPQVRVGTATSSSKVVECVQWSDGTVWLYDDAETQYASAESAAKDGWTITWSDQ